MQSRQPTATAPLRTKRSQRVPAIATTQARDGGAADAAEDAAVVEQRASADVARFYITTAIDYANGDPHLGHAFEKLGADAIARYRRPVSYTHLRAHETPEHL